MSALAIRRPVPKMKGQDAIVLGPETRVDANGVIRTSRWAKNATL